ncbi:hypothetical protein [Ancylobacter sp. TS-1]|uniref:hypothetical protein n=1 Tax=Ancylobacter sp. TS-1 TaxID=1850374 RepID=UPI001265BD6F|nr:hypothetical protein [Ancylobacter sp. TS-1]QFR34015.1 hypothetical protein GBB76_13320 [Ancylobacter sp. TS-1]
MVRISLEDRLAINALVDALVADGDRFDTAQAVELITKLPVSPRSSPFGFSARVSGEGTSQGYAAGIGNTSVTSDETKTFTAGSDRRWRIGGYAIEHKPGLIEISLLWEDTLEDRTGKACRLTYDPASRQPIAMLLARELSVSIGPLFVTYGRVFDAWKRPA